MAFNLLVKLIVCICFTSLISFPIAVDCDPIKNVTSSHIWLTVSSQVHRTGIFSLKYVQRELVFNWQSLPIQLDTWIGLFDRPLNGSYVTINDAIYTLSQLESSAGEHQTSIEFPVFQFQDTLPLVSQCLKYYLAWVEGNKIIEVNCIKIQPNWMNSIMKSIESKPIKSLVIPGTHNSGSYSIGFEAGFISGILDSYTLCQDESVFNQLVYGNRYLDIRVRYDEKNSEHFWVGHGAYPIQKTIREVLVQIKRFLDSTTNEIVLLDFHRFPIGFENNGIVNMTRHYELLDLVQSIVGDDLVDNSDGKDYERTVNSILTSGNRRLLLGHAEWARLQQNFLFPNVQQVWAETDSINRLMSYFDENLCLGYSRSYAAMAQLTPEAIKLLQYGGLRKMAQSVNPLVSKWFQLGQKLNQCANIISSDYFLGNNIIDIAIASNQ